MDFKLLKQQSDEVYKGTKEIICLNKEEEYGRQKGDREAVEISILISDCKRNGKKESSLNSKSQRDFLEKELLNYAEKEACLFSREDIQSKFNFDLDAIKEGAESLVFLLEKSNVAVKLIDPYVYLANDKKFLRKDSDLLDFFNNKIALYNYIFPETRCKVLGVTKGSFKNKYSKLRIVIEQALIRGESLAEKIEEIEKKYGNDSKEVKEYRTLLKEKIKEDLQKRLENTTLINQGVVYRNKDYFINDLHFGNILEVDTVLFYIDANPTLNTKITPNGSGVYEEFKTIEIL